MKKLILLAAVLLGAATASQAGVRFSFGLGIPVGPVVCPPPVVYQAPPVYTAPAPVVVSPPPVVYAPPAPPVVYAPPARVYFGFGPYWGGHYHGYWGHARGWGYRGWYR